MSDDTPFPPPERCNLLALRQAVRRATQFYDEILAPSGVRGTQFSILAKLRHGGPMAIGDMARLLVMDRTTLGRNLEPLQRAKLVVLRPGQDRRQREIHLTAKGRTTIDQAIPLWRKAQAGFEARYGGDAAARLRAMLRDVTLIAPAAE
ncbi:MAG TPA: MarR family winged helix-turn-helix transcriptional regulator [Stellaceae bacterium]|nr:MarR family winged helix-turn-helix transcriptional regulator [Stellaceae bacterium]